MTSKEAVLEQAAEHRVKFVRLQFTDILGVLKNVAIPVKQLETVLENGAMFDGSSIEGFTRIEESDMMLRPDLSTFAIFPWSAPEERTARLICDVYTPNGEPFPGDPRYVLKRVLAEAAEMGFTCYTGPECEFFLLPLGPNGRPTTETHDEAGYFDLGPIDRGEVARRDIIVSLEEMGFDVEASHHEVAPGQHEIDFRFDEALVTADRVATFKFVTRSVAHRHGLHATFMPKPIYGVNGSGMHVSLSLFRNGKNAFYDPAGRYQLSETALHFIGGLLRHAPAFTAVANPLVNSYKRLVPGYEAPVYICWSAHNRSALVRVPAAREQGTRAELRSPDPSCNPYLAFAAILKAGLDGVKNRIEPPASLNKNIYHMSPAERAEAGVASLPGSLAEALAALAKDPVIQEALGDHVYSRFREAKQIEWDLYRIQVHAWEIEQYLGVF